MALRRDATLPAARTLHGRPSFNKVLLLSLSQLSTMSFWDDDLDIMTSFFSPIHNLALAVRRTYLLQYKCFARIIPSIWRNKTNKYLLNESTTH